MTKQEQIVASHKNVHVALMAAQGEMGPLIKGATNPHFKTKYADLADLVQAVRVPLNNNGLTFYHQIIRGDDFLDMRTTLMHGATETCIACDVPLIVAQNNMQGMKSATTYAKRIGLESVTGVAPEDDDGNDAARNPPAKAKPAPTISPDQFIKLRDLADEAGVDHAKVCAMANAPSLEEFPAAKFESAVKKLKATIAAKAPKPDDMGGDEIPDFGDEQ